MNICPHYFLPICPHLSLQTDKRGIIPALPGVVGAELGKMVSNRRGVELRSVRRKAAVWSWLGLGGRGGGCQAGGVVSARRNPRRVRV